MALDLAPDFEGYVEDFLSTGLPFRLLYVFLGLSEMHPSDPHGFCEAATEGQKDVWIEILFTAHEVAIPEITFSSLAALADSQDPRWSMIAVAIAESEDLYLPTEPETERQLASMCRRITSGAVSGIAFFNRLGDRLEPKRIARVDRPAWVH